MQGVGFRWFAQRTAVRAGAAGWVRNLPDGRVEALVEGEPDTVSRVERALRSGPSGARVDHVEVAVVEPSGEDRTFSIT